MPTNKKYSGRYYEISYACKSGETHYDCIWEYVFAGCHFSDQGMFQLDADLVTHVD